MLARTISLAAIAVLLSVGSTAAEAKSNHKLSGTVRVAPVSVSGTLPTLEVGVAGTLKARPDGSGAVVGMAKYTGSTAVNAFTFAGSFTAFLPEGSLRGTLKGTATVQALNKIVYAGNVRVIRGTGRYEGATGRLKFTGNTTLAVPVTMAPLAVAAIRLRGTIRY